MPLAVVASMFCRGKRGEPIRIRSRPNMHLSECVSIRLTSRFFRRKTKIRSDCFQVVAFVPDRGVYGGVGIRVLGHLL